MNVHRRQPIAIVNEVLPLRLPVPQNRQQSLQARRLVQQNSVWRQRVLGRQGGSGRFLEVGAERGGPFSELTSDVGDD